MIQKCRSVLRDSCPLLQGSLVREGEGRGERGDEGKEEKGGKRRGEGREGGGGERGEEGKEEREERRENWIIVLMKIVSPCCCFCLNM